LKQYEQSASNAAREVAKGGRKIFAAIQNYVQGRRGDARPAQLRLELRRAHPAGFPCSRAPTVMRWDGKSDGKNSQLFAIIRKFAKTGADSPEVSLRTPLRWASQEEL
jgi:hypothetical protein